ncbi:MAG: zeta toxin family protein [Clostridia bacterium]|nr:zeta toxin family protein [Clostridia bacterium]
MKLEEALEKYRIPIPIDSEFYSEKYINYFKNKNSEIDQQLERFRPFQEMYIKSFYATFYKSEENKKLSDKNAKAVVLGGQTGAGKSGLVSLSKREFLDNGEQIYLIDDDLFRKFYPKSDEILKECPEFFTVITAIGSSAVTPKIMKYASDNKLNFIFDGTLKNPRIINTAMSWEGYTINWKIMATSKTESLLSIFERNEELRKMHAGRLITVNAHNETYIGLEPTVIQLENIPDVGRIQVYSRGVDKQYPVKQYDSEIPGKYSSAYVALKTIRNENEKQYSEKEILTRIKKLLNSEIPLNENEIMEINVLKDELLNTAR